VSDKATVKKIAVAGLALPVLAAGGYGVAQLQQWGQAQDRDGAHGQNVFNDAAARAIDPQLIAWREVETIDTGLKYVSSFAAMGDTHLAVVGGDGSKTLKILSRQGDPPVIVPLPAESLAIAVQDDRIFVGVRDHIEIFGRSGTRTAQWPSFGTAAVITSIHIHGPDIYIADAGQRIVYRADAQGNVQQRFGRKDDATHAPGFVLPSPHLDVAVDAAGMVWINNPGLHELEGFDATGTMVRRWGAPGMSIDRFAGCCNPTDFALLHDGRFVTAEKGAPRIKIYAHDGQFQNVVAGPDILGEEAGGMDVWADSRGRVWVAQNRAGLIRVFEPKQR